MSFALITAFHQMMRLAASGISADALNDNSGRAACSLQFRDDLSHTRENGTMILHALDDLSARMIFENRAKLLARSEFRA